MFVWRLVQFWQNFQTSLILLIPTRMITYTTETIVSFSQLKAKHT